MNKIRIPLSFVRCQGHDLAGLDSIFSDPAALELC